MKKLRGVFDIRSDRDGARYSITFKPEVPQHSSPYPDGFTTDLNTEQVVDLFCSEHREPHLAQARSEGFVRFTGSIAQEDYEKYAGF